jgi:hypothetical protein
MHSCLKGASRAGGDTPACPACPPATAGPGGSGGGGDGGNGGGDWWSNPSTWLWLALLAGVGVPVVKGLQRRALEAREQEQAQGGCACRGAGLAGLASAAARLPALGG